MPAAQTNQDIHESKNDIPRFDKEVASTGLRVAETFSPAHDFGQLPIEMVQEIIMKLTASKDLFNLCLVCKLFKGWLTPRLYESVFLSSGQQIIYFSTTVSRNPALGCLVRDLWMIESVRKGEREIPIPKEDEDSDGSEWTPEVVDSDDDSSSVSSSEGSDLEPETGNSWDSGSEFDDVNIPFHQPVGTSDFPRHFILIYPHAATPRPGSSTMPSSGHVENRHSMHAETKLWMELLCPIMTYESVVYGHACAVLGACPSLRSLYLPWSGSSAATCLRSLLPSTQLQELAVYRISDLGLAYKKLQSASILMDLSSVQRLTIFDTTFQKLNTELPDIFPALTHLRISLNVSDDMTACLSRFTRLTHLWFAPPQGDWHPQVDIEAFLLDLQTRCPGIKRVRVDFPLGSNDAPQSFGVANWELFPFVRVRSSMLRDTKNMWVYDLEYPFHDPPHGEAPSILMHNAYAECLKHYWTLKFTGGGWDD